MTERRRLRGLFAGGVALVVAGGVTLGFTVAAMVAGAAASLVVSPSTGLSPGKKVTVTGSGLDALNGQLVAVTECGNADSSGKALAGTQPAQSDCYGAESVGTQTLLTTVTNGAATTQYPVQTQNIGANKVECIAKPPANFPCAIAMADVNTLGKALQISATIAFAGSGPTTTTTTGSTPTTTGSTSPTTGSTPTPSGSAKTLTQGIGITISSTTTTRPGTSTTASGSAASTSTSSAAAAPGAPTAPVKGNLAFTGVNANVMWAAVAGFVLIDLGYLALSISRRPRWARQLVATMSPVRRHDEAPGR